LLVSLFSLVSLLSLVS